MAATLASMAPCTLNATTVPVQGVSIDPAVKSVLSHHSGNEYPTLEAVNGSQGKIVLQIPFVPAFNLLGFTALKLTTCDIFLATFANLLRQSGANHTKYGLNTSCTAAAQITSCSIKDGALVANVEIVPLSTTGILAPLVPTSSVALPSLSSQPQLVTQGPVTINGTVRTGLISTEINLNGTLDARYDDDGVLYPIVAARTQGQPEMVFQHSDPIALSALLGMIGASISSSTVAWFRPYDATTGVVSNGGTGVSITVASGYVTPFALAASQGQVATQGFRIRGLSTSSTHPFAVSVAATIPALP